VAAVDRSEMENVIARVVELNATYEQLIELKPRQHLGPPASDRQIAQLEAYLAIQLPPSYRIFLSLHDGWRGFEANLSLLSIEEQMKGETADYIRSWKADQWAEGETLLIEGVVIGIELYTSKAWVLDTSHTDERGEMDVVNWHDFETQRDPDFLAMLNTKASYMEELVAEEQKKRSE
jgi:cell wall assembly regulator SMI1